MMIALAQFHGRSVEEATANLPEIPDAPQPPPLKPMLMLPESGRSRTRPLPTGGTLADRRYPKKQDVEPADDAEMEGQDFADARSDGATGGGG